jgi:hypothetical protein
MDEVVGDGRVQDGGGIELLAGDGGADDGKDSRADDGSDAESGERDGAKGLREGVLGPLRFGDQLVDGFSGEDLAGQRRTPNGRV